MDANPLVAAHVSGTSTGPDLFLECLKCGANEIVLGYADGRAPYHFLWMPKSVTGLMRVTCFTCGEEALRQVQIAE
ncbi:hypothetical protein [Acidovorax sp. Leaf78]|uniref:hypothetical protein n=1 Tax=Acidovorax sp. Leaf78 TaxID=1736237 RepID=UPI0006FFFA5A|nr:hypothetical protein [Acidovorax sp. Leaf78]KQO15883.1 hypothetical protein ASF16_14785 [Acidovorax sp. Leaf78]RZJ62181.1 MAG: hypothetical protein EON49_03010 [Acidovorax sp.]